MFALLASYQDNIDFSGVPTELTDTVVPAVDWRFFSDGTGQAYAAYSLVDTFNWIHPTNTTFANNYEIAQGSINQEPPVFTAWTRLGNFYFGRSMSPNSGQEDGFVYFGIRRVGTTNPPRTIRVDWFLDSGA
jgi:hypothetical protein